MEKTDKEPAIANRFTNKDILSLKQFDTTSIASLFAVTQRMERVAKASKSSSILAGTVTVLMFYEPSSRTMGSFDAAIKRLGGQTVVILNPQMFSSVSKGETFEDTIRVFETYSNAIILRHPEVGAAKRATDCAETVPIINAGDGIGEHPTQALLDLYTIWQKKKRLSKLCGLFGGDMKHGRTVHSLLEGLSIYKGNTAYLLSPKQLRLNADMKAHFVSKGLTVYEIEDTTGIPKDCDFWYWTRVQKERFANEAEYKKLNNKFIVTLDVFNKYAGKNTILMHPLPRVGEIAEEVDQDPRAEYLRSQVRNGMYVRMALMAKVLGRA